MVVVVVVVTFLEAVTVTVANVLTVLLKATQAV